MESSFSVFLKPHQDKAIMGYIRHNIFKRKQISVFVMCSLLICCPPILLTLLSTNKLSNLKFRTFLFFPLRKTGPCFSQGANHWESLCCICTKENLDQDQLVKSESRIWHQGRNLQRHFRSLNSLYVPSRGPHPSSGRPPSPLSSPTLLSPAPPSS